MSMLQVIGIEMKICIIYLDTRDMEEFDYETHKKIFNRDNFIFDYDIWFLVNRS